ncbi:RNA 2'-phosphotransferase [Kitasatospora sp. NPDC058046]|uniref:RNA 2'-phosphotransferase n=1 Tax=Kitasatospora sp. NPDC058046 TaxID=3346312 RepID=UPI0036DE7214
MNVDKRVTPLDLARRTPPPVSGLSEAEIRLALEKHCPELVTLLHWLGCSLDETLSEWIQFRGAPWVSTIVNLQTPARRIFELWQEFLGDDSRPLLELLVFEHGFCRPAATSQGLPPGMHFAKTLHVVRQRIGTKLHQHALDVTWQRPTVFSRALRLAEVYLDAVVSDSELTSANARHQFSGRLGQGAVLLSRFEPVGTAELSRSVGLIRRSIEEGNKVTDAVPYLLEGFLRLHDSTGDRRYLGQIIEAHREFTDAEKSAAWRLHVAEAWLRLADGRPMDERTAHYLDQAVATLDVIRNFVSGEAIRQTLLLTIVAQARAVPESATVQLALRGLPSQFGFEQQVQRFVAAGAPASSFPVLVLGALTERFNSSGEPLIRRLLADWHRACAQFVEHPTPTRLELRRTVLDLLEGRTAGTALTDTPSRMRYADDLLHVAALNASPQYWTEGVVRLVREAADDPSTCVPLVVLGREAELRRSVSPADRATLEARLTGLVSDPASWVHALAHGDSGFYYTRAATRAMTSPDVTRRNLGGRSNVVTVEDHLGFASSTLVFKPTHTDNVERDTRTAQAVQTTLDRVGASTRFRTSDLITTLDADKLSSRSGLASSVNVITVRRFEHGKVLAELLSPETEDASADLLKQAASFLAYIHAAPRPGDAKPTKVRAKVRGRVRMWLRDVFPKGADKLVDQAFDSWWALLADAPTLPRRDAHAFNWLVTDNGKIVAIDLEATGHEPVGCELAQLTDDVPALSPGSWDLRREVFESYVEALRECTGEPYDDAEVKRIWAVYRASLVVRAVRCLTDRTGDPALRRHGEALLDEISAHPEWGSVHEVAVSLRDAWAERRGAPGGAPLRELNLGRKRRISKALAYQLRHNPHLPTNPQGWARLDDLLSALSETGQPASSAEVLAVAQALDEPRFEVWDDLIRARYGHTTTAPDDHAVGTPDGVLYHATASVNLRDIFQLRQGLRPMARKAVHLTTHPRTALLAGRRHGPAVLLSVHDPAAHGLECRYAGGTTWLIDAVPTGALAVVPLHQLFSAH